MWQALISPITSLLGQVLKNKAEEKAAVHQAKMQVIQNTASWEQLMASASATSWKDEWFTILLSAPVVALMWGIGMNDVEIIDRIGLAFSELNRLPDWYQYLLFMAVSASFGIRGADKLLALKGKKQMAQELDIFQDTAAAEDVFADSTMQAEQSASECPEGFSYNAELGACVADDFKLDLGNNQTPFGIDLRPLYENRPPPVIQGEDGQMYRNNTYLTASGWVEEPDYSTPVYFFHQPLELGDPREIYYTLSEEGSLESQFGTWRTEEEIRGYWDAEQGMGYFKEANPNLDFDTWFSFIKEASALSASGLNRNDNPEEFEALVNKYGIATSFQNPDGDIFEWNGSSFTKTYKVDDSIPVGDIIMSVAIGYFTAGVLGPGGAFGSSGLFGGGAAGGAASGAIGSAIAQGVVNGKIDPTSVVTAGVLGGVSGWFDSLNEAQWVTDGGGWGGWVDSAGNVLGPSSQWMIDKTQSLANLLGIPFNEASGIIEGVLNGTIKGEDLEGIAINAVGGWSEAKIKGFLTNSFGEGVNVDNWFREGDSFIPTEAFFPFVETAIQAAIDGGVSKVDLLRMLGAYFKAGGDLDFILPGLPDLKVDFDFCEEFPGFPLCTQQGFCPPGWDIDEDGICIEPPVLCGEGYSWDPQLGKCTLITIDVPEMGCDSKEIVNGVQRYVYDTNLGECIPDVIECIEGFDLVGQECVKVDVPDTSCPRKEIANGVQTYVWDQNLGECVPDVIECIEGFDLVGQECVKIPEVNCDEGQEYNTELGKCVDISIEVPEVNCDEGQEYNTELGKCIDIEGPDIDVDLPDIDVDLPSVSLGQPAAGKYSQTQPKGLSNKEVAIQPLVQPASFDAMAGISDFITRHLHNMDKRKSATDISDAFNSDPDKKRLFT